MSSRTFEVKLRRSAPDQSKKKTTVARGTVSARSGRSTGTSATKQNPSTDTVGASTSAQALVPAAGTAGGGAGGGGRLHRWRRRARERFVHHRASLAWFVPIAVISMIVQLVNLGGAPQRIDDEGTYAAQAWAVLNLGELTHYTYWYDHPPLGWLQIAAWTGLTGGFERYALAVVAAREFMVVCQLASMVALWMLARRVGFARPAAAAAVAIFAFSPLAVQFHRTVFLDNVATPWLLAAAVLALAPRRQLAAFAAAAVCFAIAVLTKETYLLFAPFLVWMMLRNADRTTRRYTISVSAALLVLSGLSYVLLALIKGELVPGAGRVSLMTGIGFQLGGRAGSGSLFDAGSQARVTTDQWLQLDPALAVIAPICAIVALADKRLRPLAVALLFHLVFMLRPGYLPIPYVIVMLPLAGLVIAGAVQVIVRAGKGRAWRRDGSYNTAAAMRRLGTGIAAAVCAAVMVAFAVPTWAPQLRGLVAADLDQPMRQAQTWVDANVGRDYRLIVDDAMWVDLVSAGFPRDNVVWYYKVDTDPAVQALAPQGWQDYDYVISTNSMRTFPDGFPLVRQAMDNSVLVARFGDGDRAVEVLRVNPDGAAAAAETAAREQAARIAAGTALANNPALQMDRPTQDLITGGRLDSRALIGLARVATLGDLTVADLPADPAEEQAQLPRRQVLISRIDGRTPTAADADAVTAQVTQQAQRFAAQRVEQTPGGLLITWSVDSAPGLLPADEQAGG